MHDGMPARLAATARRGGAGVTCALLALAAPPVLAETVFSPPGKCEAFVTAQLANCTVMHLMRCAGDPEGHLTQVSFYLDGTMSVAIYDDDGQFVSWSNIYVVNGETMRDEQVDPSSLTRLLETGEDDYDEIVDYVVDGTFVNYVGRQVLTDTPVEIDGIVLDLVRHEFQIFDQKDVLIRTVSQVEYVSREWRTVFVGFGESTESGGVFPQMDMSPVEFSLPGEPGFMAAAPTVGCSG